MSFLSRPGMYFGKPIDWTMDETKEGLPKFVMRFRATHLSTPQGWVEVDGEITGYFYPVKRDGQRNDGTVEMLSKVLGWDGASFESLHGGNYASVETQIDVREEEYQGRKSLKVAWINPGDYSGSTLEKKDVSKVKSFDEKFGNALRGGLAPAIGPAKNLPPGAGKTKAPAPAPKQEAAGADIPPWDNPPKEECPI